MKISEAAKLTGMNVSSIRFYERKGLLLPERESGSKYRDYTEADVQRIKQIFLYRKIGISVETIELLLKGKANLREVLAEQKRLLEEQITELKGASELCKLVMKETEIPENEKLEEYLNYVYQEEKKGGRFAEVRELLEDLGDYSATAGVWGISFMGMGMRKWLVGAGAVGVLLFMIVVFGIRVWDAIQNMNAPSIGAAVIWGMLAVAYGTGFLNYLKSRN
ncbi:DNA-binding transcriptional MerR regulator [Blautia caecimuris]|uniref:DNA-binding transcriptional MerR regulator n=1 Tax=Blautia caecimuris TaxID=1796615 RepID=A0ABV2M3S1_9FIRM|nr:MerR family transcriptional regulator [Blautia caecimuris]MCR2002531.1 MerR family transcriptional regulator [Blautia caecimuris]